MPEKIYDSQPDPDAMGEAKSLTEWAVFIAAVFPDRLTSGTYATRNGRAGGTYYKSVPEALLAMDRRKANQGKWGFSLWRHYDHDEWQFWRERKAGHSWRHDTIEMRTA